MSAASHTLHPYAPAALLAAIAILAAPTPAKAAWPNAPALNLPVCTATGNQINPVIAPDGVGGEFIAWLDLRTGPGRVYAQHILGSGVVDPAWPVNGLPVTTNAPQQTNPRIVSDGGRGAIVSWEDSRTLDWDIYAQHLIATGVDPAWPATGRAVCTDPTGQNYHSSVSDGAGGVILAWNDNRNYATNNVDVYAQHVLASGVVDPAWPVNGRAIVTAPGLQGVTIVTLPMPMVSDGAGGAIIGWADYRSGAWDVYAQHVLASGAVDPLWPVNGMAVCAAAGDQYYPFAVGDGSGGAIVTWEDHRSGIHAYAQHITATGTIAPLWPANGLSTNTGIGFQYVPVIATDGAGGAIIFWDDTRSDGGDTYAQHLTANGVDPAWPADGVAVLVQPSYQYPGGAVPDGAGGAIVFCGDGRSGGYDLYAQHVLASGSVDSRWPSGGRAICTASGDQYPTPFPISDGAGGIVATWTDPRTGAQDVYAQRVARFGYLGTPEPEIASVRDVPNDQGGKVKLSWYASYLDTNNDPNLNYYEIYRSIAPNIASEAVQRGAHLMSGVGEVPKAGERAILAPSAVTGPYFWELLFTEYVTHFLPTYSYVAATASDSTGAYNPRTAFMVVGRNYDGTYYWMSRPDSGYSVDNLPPGTPAPFTGQYASGTAVLHWNPNPESDLANYRLYRGTTTSFVPGPSNLVAAPPDTGFAYVAGAPYYYKLSAVDTHGNESGYALLTPTGTLDASGGDLTSRVTLATPWPNPANESARFTLALPRAARVSLGIFDAGGRRVRELVSGSLPAGEHARVWDLRDQPGRRVAPGLYFATLEVDGGRVTRRFVVR